MTLYLLLAATALGGLLAGGNVDRTFVAMPAWGRLGAEAWAAFSRKADLGNGLILYPLEAIGAAVLTLAAIIAFQFDPAAPVSMAWPLYAALIFAALGLALTIKAAPIVLGIRDTTDRTQVERAFAGFRYWGDLRGVCQALSFLAQLAALALAGAGS